MATPAELDSQLAQKKADMEKRIAALKKQIADLETNFVNEKERVMAQKERMTKESVEEVDEETQASTTTGDIATFAPKMGGGMGMTTRYGDFKEKGKKKKKKKEKSSQKIVTYIDSILKGLKGD